MVNPTHRCIRREAPCSEDLDLPHQPNHDPFIKHSVQPSMICMPPAPLFIFRQTSCNARLACKIRLQAAMLEPCRTAPRESAMLIKAILHVPTETQQISTLLMISDLRSSFRCSFDRPALHIFGTCTILFS